MQKTPMRHSQLRAFHHVARAGGFSSAAAALNMTQPSVSDQVKRLEQAHDVLLFHRDARQVRLTDAGAALFRLTQEYFETEDRIGAFLDRNTAAVTGTLRIVADSALHVAEAIERFRTANPKVFVSIRTGNTARILRMLRRYEAEVGVVADMAASGEFDSIDRGATPIVVIARKGVFADPARPVTFDEVAQHPLVFREDGSRTRDSVLASAKAAGVSLRPAIEVEGREALREVVATGAGIGFISLAEFGGHPGLDQIPLAAPDLAMEQSIVVLRARRDVPVIRAFMKLF